jgi:hypothetical protein
MALRYWLKTNKLRRFTYLDCSKLLILGEKEAARIDQESELAMGSERKEVGVEISGQRGPDDFQNCVTMNGLTLFLETRPYVTRSANVFPLGQWIFCAGRRVVPEGIQIDLILPSDSLVAGQTAPLPHPQGNRSPRDRERGYQSNLDPQRKRLPFLSYCSPQTQDWFLGWCPHIHKGPRDVVRLSMQDAQRFGRARSAQIIVLNDTLEFTDCVERGKQQSVLLDQKEYRRSLRFGPRWLLSHFGAAARALQDPVPPERIQTAPPAPDRFRVHRARTRFALYDNTDGN